MELFSYWRSSAAYRVRIGLNLKQLPHRITPVHLVREGGQQHSAAYAALNPQELVPTLCHDGRVLQQSMAILEYLDELFPLPALLPDDAAGRARVRALAQLVACDVHPLNNLRVMQFFSDTWNVPQVERDDWTRHWMRVGFDAMERMRGITHYTDDIKLPGMLHCKILRSPHPHANILSIDTSRAAALPG
ncbi:MAG: maleylacetoacetate isomerase, partial [Stenotrophomonas sp.]